ncbi:VAN3-binding protein, partial [Cucurbita argyrosperma subsp. sororia]
MSRPSSLAPLDSSLEFLSRSWRVSPSTHLVNSRIPAGSHGGGNWGDIVLENSSSDADGFLVFMNPFSFTSSETSQMVMDRILSHSDVSPRTSGRLSHSSGPLNAAHSGGSLTDSPPFSPSEIADLDSKLYRSNYSFNTHFRATVNGSGTAAVGGGKTVGRWLKERKERRKEENRVQNAQLHAAISVAGVAAAIAAIASASASSNGVNDREDIHKTDIALASAATLVAAQCVEAAEAMGAEHDHLASVISSAVNVKSAGDIMTLTAAAATALRGAATLKSRATKDVWNAAEKGMGGASSSGEGSSHGSLINNIVVNQKLSGDQLQPCDSKLDIIQPICYRGLLAKGCELLKRTRNGDLHWKLVSVYLSRTNQVVLKMKSRHVAGTITKKKKRRHLLEGGEDRRYFGVKTLLRGVVEFECRNQREYDMWTQGVAKLLLVAAERICRF